MIQPGIVKVEAMRLAKLAAKQEIKDAGLKLTESGKARKPLLRNKAAATRA
jgi:hypothetical protein